MRLGAPCVMDSGQDLMHKWPADSWDTLQVVCMGSIYLCGCARKDTIQSCSCKATVNTQYLNYVHLTKLIATYNNDYIATSYLSGATVFYNAYFGQGFGPIFLDDLLCTSREARLIDCPRSTSTGIGDIDFCRGHLDDAGLRCVESK